MQRKRKKKRRSLWLFLIILVILIIGIGTYFVKSFFAPANSVSKTILSKTNSPTQTSVQNGYVSQSSSEVQAALSTGFVADAGTPEWVKVPSPKKLNKFTDLSKNGLTIYRINNPEVLKTTQTLAQTLVRMSDMIAIYPNTLIMNASAFAMGTTNEVVGLQINNGKLLGDWPPTGTQYAFVINKDGSCKIYDSATSADTIIQNGGMQSYDFGAALIRDGQVVPSDGSVNWEIHAFIANDKDNNLYVILSDTNAGYNTIMAGVKDLNLKNMLLLDSGGSSQLSVNGKVIVASQDDRAVPDFIVMR
ncbi:phosphodiester glycosidase family protein [Lactovum miscens]|uniref:Exopolysaccharide biosynthesis protein n=1 Tax=Lactovum miscens TaxID=190387 RepID=A0A841C5C0_9LACT|nr:phosphodiester glycosidase family protein [Lactovum miscens]MBB5888003.1 exopolysaccharide biosynthesis protein [Lactovum miscens]